MKKDLYSAELEKADEALSQIDCMKYDDEMLEKITSLLNMELLFKEKCYF